MPSYFVPYAALSIEASRIKDELMRAIEKVLDGGRYILGPEVGGFESEFAKYCQTEFACGVDNGTSALFLALRAMGIQEGDEVITAPNSFVASASSIVLAGAKPVFIDIANDGNIDPQRLEEAITPKTRAIMPVHLT
ncbi:MAG: DegT/DnrJ/EryC1/StrS family aminotransferase, partial [Deltaproteobacteria bacterium]|nr:DegT/DnrJ/EryC1/StrS family aminotransferase [Deltaproteobacteria bacterium]